VVLPRWRSPDRRRRWAGSRRCRHRGESCFARRFKGAALASLSLVMTGVSFLVWAGLVVARADPWAAHCAAVPRRARLHAEFLGGDGASNSPVNYPRIAFPTGPGAERRVRVVHARFVTNRTRAERGPSRRGESCTRWRDATWHDVPIKMNDFNALLISLMRRAVGESRVLLGGANPSLGSQ